MATRAVEPEPRTPLTERRVVNAAIELADEHGLEAVTMRAVAQALGVEAMSLYHHVANKEALLDGIGGLLVEEIEQEIESRELPAPHTDWKGALRKRILIAREVMVRHPWAPTLFETRTVLSPSVVRYHDEVLGIMRAGGFSWNLAHHAIHALGSRALGFTQELFQPDSDEDEAATDDMLAEMVNVFPNIVNMLAEVSHDEPGATLGWCDDQTEFEFGLDLLLDGLERLNRAG